MSTLSPVLNSLDLCLRGHHKRNVGLPAAVFNDLAELRQRAGARGTARHCATSRKVAGSIPNGVNGIFHLHNPSSRTISLGLTQPLTEMSTRNVSCRVKAAGAYGWQPYYLHVSIVLKPGSFNLLEPSGPVQACNGIALPLPLPFTWIFLRVSRFEIYYCIQ